MDREPCAVIGYFRDQVPAWVASLALGVVAILMTGCDGASPLARAGVEALQPPEGWEPSEVSEVVVPGRPLAAWTGPHESSLVVFRDLPYPRTTAAMLAEEQANRLTGLPELEILVQRTETWSDEDAARIELVAPGTGDRIAPSGTGQPVSPDGRPLVPTHRVSVGFPRSDVTLWLYWHFPAEVHEELRPQVEQTLRTLRLREDRGRPATY